MGGWGGRERGAEGGGYLPGRGIRGVGGGALAGVLVGRRFFLFFFFSFLSLC